VFDDLGVKPRRIAGTSIGAIMGALYASGLSAKEIRELIAAWMSTESKKWSRAMVSMNIFKWIDLIDPGLGKGGLISSDKFLGFLHQAIKQPTFQKLNIPLKIVATDFWKGEQVVFERGELLPAVKASMALPGIFDPVSIGGRIFIDGGTVNPLPYDLLLRESGTTVAIDASGSVTDQAGEVPSFFDTIFHTFHVMGQAILQDKLQLRRPDIYIKPDILDIKALDFLKSETIYRQAAPAKEQLKRGLDKLLT
jgi:NTE family protein